MISPRSFIDSGYNYCNSADNIHWRTVGSMLIQIGPSIYNKIHFFDCFTDFSPSLIYSILMNADVGNTRDYWVLVLCPSSGILKNIMFRKLDLFPSSGETVCCTWERKLLFRKMIDVYSESHEEHINTFCVQHAEIPSVKTGWPYSNHWDVTCLETHMLVYWFGWMTYTSTGLIRGTVIKFVDCGFIASYFKVFTYTYTDPHRPSK
jgi:hypothetical protein